MKATIDFTALTEFAVKLENLGSTGDEIAKKAVYEGAGILADAVRSNLTAVIKGPSTGDLLASLGIAPIRSGGGCADTSVGFDGYDSKGVPNAVKARAKESGTSKQKATPFVRPAVNQAKGAALRKIDEVIQKEIEKNL